MSFERTRRGFLAGFALLGAVVGVGLWRQSSSAAKETMGGLPVIKSEFDLDFQWPIQGPILFCVHHHDNYPEGRPNLAPDPKHLKGRNVGQDFVPKDGFRMYHGETIPGFPVHPHRGFETVTIVRKGYVDHADSMGAAGRYGEEDYKNTQFGGWPWPQRDMAHGTALERFAKYPDGRIEKPKASNGG